MESIIYLIKRRNRRCGKAALLYVSGNTLCLVIIRHHNDFVRNLTNGFVIISIVITAVFCRRMNCHIQALSFCCQCCIQFFQERHKVLFQCISAESFKVNGDPFIRISAQFFISHCHFFHDGVHCRCTVFRIVQNGLRLCGIRQENIQIGLDTAILQFFYNLFIAFRHCPFIVVLIKGIDHNTSVVMIFHFAPAKRNSVHFLCQIFLPIGRKGIESMDKICITVHFVIAPQHHGCRFFSGSCSIWHKLPIAFAADNAEIICQIDISLVACHICEWRSCLCRR